MTITASVSDSYDAITLVQFYVNGVLQCSGTSYTCYWNVPVGKSGYYSLSAYAHDQAGNVGSTAVTVTS